MADFTDLRIRPAIARDLPGIIALIDAVYWEYGERICLEGADSDLLAAHESYGRRGGEFVVLTDEHRILGTHAILPLRAPEVCTFRRLYLDNSLRGQRWGEQVMNWAIETALARGFSRVEFWSDTRFLRAHRFFERLGFVRTGEVRAMHDGHVPYQEYFFWMAL